MIATWPCTQKHIWMHNDFFWPHNTLLWEVLQLPQFVHNLTYVQWLDMICLFLFCVFVLVCVSGCHSGCLCDCNVCLIQHEGVPLACSQRCTPFQTGISNLQMNHLQHKCTECIWRQRIWRLQIMRFWWDKSRTNFHSKFTWATLANERSCKLVRLGQTTVFKLLPKPQQIPTKQANLLQHQIQFSVPDHSVSLGLPCNLRVLWEETKCWNCPKMHASGDGVPESSDLSLQQA